MTNGNIDPTAAPAVASGGLLLGSDGASSSGANGTSSGSSGSLSFGFDPTAIFGGGFTQYSDPGFVDGSQAVGGSIASAPASTDLTPTSDGITTGTSSFYLQPVTSVMQENPDPIAIGVIYSGQTSSGLSLPGSVGGGLSIASGGIAIGTQVGSDGFVFDYGSAGATLLANGGWLSIASGGSAIDTLVDSGGSIFIGSGGFAARTIISSGGIEKDAGTGFDAVVASSGTEQILYGAVASGLTVEGFGTATVYQGGTLDNGTIDGGFIDIASGATVDGTIGFTSVGGGLEIDATGAFGTPITGYANGSYTSATGDGSVAYFGGPWTWIDFAAISFGSDTTITFAEASDNLSGTLVVSDGIQSASVVLAGQYTGSDFIGRGGATGTRIDPSSIFLTGAGPTITGTTIESGTTPSLGGIPQPVTSVMQEDPDPITMSTVSAGQTFSGLSFPHSNEGVLLIAPGGIAIGTQIGSGGTVFVMGSAADTTAQGGLLYTLSGGIITDSIAGGGLIDVDSGAVAFGTVLSSGGSANDSGIDIGTVVESGGAEYIYSGGIASALTVDEGGSAVVSGGATLESGTINGGTLEITSGASVSGPLGFASGGGTLQIDSTGTFGAMVGGFSSGAILDAEQGETTIPGTTAIDFTAIAWGSNTSFSFSEASNNLSGTLTVSDGTNSASLTLLGQYMAAAFGGPIKDAVGGTLIESVVTLITGDPIAPPTNTVTSGTG
ncbi:MAG TPA: AIDA repeat-containing protein [Stellaceae bacterium]|jgi:autotransporter passenger strand-loop-strand repeat protein|nr:AIDA repeat-containing protein [Stellaceae bacterium]